MKIKISEATNNQLNWLVANIKDVKSILRNGRPVTVHEFDPEGQANEFDIKAGLMYRDYSPATEWAQGGPIIEREGIDLTANGPVAVCRVVVEDWSARVYVFAEWVGGPTPLIAAMRCFVVSKLGEEVEVPEELT